MNHRLTRFVTSLVAAGSLVVSVTHAAAASVDAQRIEGIQKKHFVQFIRWLDLDDDQTTAAMALHEDFSDDYTAELVPIGRAYVSKIPSMMAEGFAESFRKHAAERRALITLMREWDERLFMELDSILRDDQRPMMRRVRNARQQQIWRTGVSEIPEGNVHLSDLVVELDLSDAEHDRVHEVLDWFEPQFIEVLKDARAARIVYYPIERKRMDAAERIAEDDQRDEQARMTPAERARAEQQVRTLLAEASDALGPSGRARLALNRKGRAAILGALDEENREHFQRLYLEASYPYVYPDPASASALYEAALELDGITDDQRDVLEMMRAEFEQQHARACEALAMGYMIREQAARSGDVDEIYAEAYSFDRIFKAGMAREELNGRQLDIIRTQLTPAQGARLPDTWDFAANPAERPWDWGKRLRRNQQIEERHRKAAEANDKGKRK